MVTLTPEKIEVTVPPDITISEPAKEILREARDIVSLGWTQQTMWREISVEGTTTYSVCMLGGIYAAAAGTRNPREISGEAVGELGRNRALYEAERAVSLVVGSVIGFNDDPQRRKEHVLAVFDELIAQ